MVWADVMGLIRGDDSDMFIKVTKTVKYTWIIKKKNQLVSFTFRL